MSRLLDTNVWIDLLKKKNITLARNFAQTPSNQMRVCPVVRSELMHGAYKYEDAVGRRQKIVNILSSIESLPFDDRCADVYADIRHDLETRGCVIGALDMQIAAIALVHDLTLVTSNVDEFQRVRGLKTEDWSVPQT